MSSTMKFPPASFWTCILAVTTVISAVTVFTWNFMAEAQELKKAADELETDQRELWQLADEISEQVEMNTMQVEKNTETLNALAANVAAIQQGVIWLVCDKNPEQLICEQQSADSGWGSLRQ